MAAVAAGAVSGALHAQRRGFDLMGVGIVGIVSGLGGGAIRDVLLGSGPALALRSPAFLATALVAALLGALFGSITTKLDRPIWIFDALTLGLFTVAGLQRAEAAGLTWIPSLLLGVVTGVGGGLARDVICRETPQLLMPGTPYAFASLFAGVSYLAALREFGLRARTAELVAVATAFGMRSLSEWLGWKVPRLPDLPTTLTQLHRRLFRAGRKRK